MDALDKTARQRSSLAVLLEDMTVAPQVQQCIWGVDETEAAETAEQFITLSLAQRDQPEGSIRLHDLQLDYVRAQYQEKKALELIHGAVRLSSNVIAKDPGQYPHRWWGGCCRTRTCRRFTNSPSESLMVCERHGCDCYTRR